MNLALRRTATQSSTLQDKYASRAVDGNTNPNSLDDSCTHTDSVDQEAWWEVDLGADRQLEAVLVTNRGDCCGKCLKTTSF